MRPAPLLGSAIQIVIEPGLVIGVLVAAVWMGRGDGFVAGTFVGGLGNPVYARHAAPTNLPSLESLCSARRKVASVP